MISIERTKELLNRQDMSDREAEEIRDAFRALVGMILDQFMRDMNVNREGGKDM